MRLAFDQEAIARIVWRYLVAANQVAPAMRIKTTWVQHGGGLNLVIEESDRKPDEVDDPFPCWREAE